MNRLIHRSVAAAAGLLLLTTAACGGGGDGGGSAEAAGGANSKSPTKAAATTEEAAKSPTKAAAETEEAAKSPTKAAATTVETATTGLGQILVDSKGMTVYMFDPDEQGRSTCEGDCLAAWPPVPGPAEAGPGADQSLLGTTKAPDGTTMATYNDWPLYYWVQDEQPGDVTGQAVNDVWWVMSPDGRPIRQMPAGSGGIAY